MVRMDKFEVKRFKEFGVVPYGTFKRKQRSARIKKGVIKFSQRVYDGTMKVYNGTKKVAGGKKGKSFKSGFERVYNNLMK